MTLNVPKSFPDGVSFPRPQSPEVSPVIYPEETQFRLRPEILESLGLPITADDCRILAFDRFGEHPSAIVLVPDSLEGQLPKPTRHFDRRTKRVEVQSAASFVPPKREARGVRKLNALGQEVAVEHTAARKVVLKVSVSRITSWGVELRLLPLPDRVGNLDLFDLWSYSHRVEWMGDPVLATAVIRGAFTLALAARRLGKKMFTAPRYPLLHNQRGGSRFLLYCDQERLGSPADLHVLVYPAGKPPYLNGWCAPDRPTADERKPGLLLASSPDAKVRFYQPTPVQWGEWAETWSKTWPQVCKHLSTDERTIIERGIIAAESLRR